MNIRIQKKLSIILVILFLLTGCNFLGSTNSDTNEPNTENVFAEQTFPTASPAISETIPEEVPDDLKIIWEAWTILNNEYVDQDKVKDNKLPEFAVRGLLSALGDRQTSYVDIEYLEAQFSDIFYFLIMRRDLFISNWA